MNSITNQKRDESVLGEEMSGGGSVNRFEIFSPCGPSFRDMRDYKRAEAEAPVEEKIFPTSL